MRISYMKGLLAGPSSNKSWFHVQLISPETEYDRLDFTSQYNIYICI